MSAIDRQAPALLGESPPFQSVLDQVSEVAPLNKPILIIGERGTGKELIAARLHFLSSRWEHTFLKINCAALPESLLESELFGYEAGAFTGAGKRHSGRFERADEGTLFLDEISSMSLRVQEKLLRVIEYGEYERLGGNQTITTDVRIIAAANQDLPKMAEAGEFRADLLDRLSFDVLTLPPLRARSADIDLLAEHFAMGMTKELQRELFAGFSEQAMMRLREYHWPGNIRELKNVVERAVYRSAPEQAIDDIVFDPFDSPYRPGTSQERVQPTAEAAAHDDQTATLPTTDVTAITDFREHMREYEIQCLRQALQQHQHHQQNTAKALGLSYNQLRSYLRKYNKDLQQ